LKIVEKENIEIEKLIAIQCDKCKVRYNDVMETQEFLFINFVGGYNSIFGDGDKIEGDICQHCFKEVLGEYLTVTSDD